MMDIDPDVKLELYNCCRNSASCPTPILVAHGGMVSMRPSWCDCALGCANAIRLELPYLIATVTAIVGRH